MADARQARRIAGRAQAPSIAVSPAKLMTTEGIPSIFHDDQLWAAMWRLALHSWVHGPIPEDRAARVAMSSESITRLIEAGVLVRVSAGVVLPWVEDARSDVDARSVASRKAAEARWKGPVPDMPVHADAVPDDANACERMRTHAAAPEGTPTAPARACAGVRVRTEEKENQNHTGSLFGSTTNGALPVLSKPSEPKARTLNAREAKPAANPLIALWDEEWNALRPEPWAWSFGRDLRSLKEALKHAGGDELALRAKIRAMLNSSDSWFARNASPALLVSKWNTVGVEVRPLTPSEQARAMRGRK